MDQLLDHIIIITQFLDGDYSPVIDIGVVFREALYLFISPITVIPILSYYNDTLYTI